VRDRGRPDHLAREAATVGLELELFVIEPEIHGEEPPAYVD
jgi:hypothetical protein